MPSLIDKPRIGYAVSLVIAALGYVGYVNKTIASLERDSENRDKTREIVLKLKQTEADDMKLRIAALEARNCKP